MRKRHTILEARFPGTPDFATMAASWSADAVDKMLIFVWAAYDRLTGQLLAGIDLPLADKDVERSITMSLEPRIRDEMSGDEPFFVQHERFEHETMLAPPAQPPQYDIAFVWRANERVMWPLEAKVLRNDSAVSAYVADVKNEFLTCRYAPFVESGAMIGYLVSGTTARAFANIATSLKCELTTYQPFARRDHKVSDHTRRVPARTAYPARFRCHHLLMPMH